MRTAVRKAVALRQSFSALPCLTMSHLALDSITIEGFKSIKGLSLDLRPINVVIGANGAGKSNLIGAFDFLHSVRDGELAISVARAGGANKLLHFGTKATAAMSFRLSFLDGTNQYEVKLSPTGDDGLIPAEESVYFWDKAYRQPYGHPLTPIAGGREAGISDPSLRRIGAYVRDHLGKWRVFHVHDTSASSPMRLTAKLDDNRYLRSDASNLASFLYLLREQHRDSYDLIRRTVQRVAPFFEDFSLSPLRLQPGNIKLEWKHKGSDLYFDASSFSDGTLRFVALATLFLQPLAFRPSVILVDEPELGLHPYAIELLASLIRQASVATQVIVSTQSSLLLDHFDPEDVVVANRIEGATEISRLQSESLREWLADYSLGQLWEKNELEGRPVAE